jgi:tRNA-splicing ligase RtcB
MNSTTGFPVALPGAQAETLMWAHPHEVEPAALDQLRNISRLPWVHGVRVMPDVHLGKGATVGSVVAMKDAVSPSAVGVDIGCGMQAVRTSLTLDDLPDDLHQLRLAVEAAIPVGFASHDTAPNVKRLGLEHGRYAGWSKFWNGFGDLHAGVQDREGRAQQQMGTLGGGNHFLELTVDDDEQVWLMLHSGSRNIGKEIAERHIGEAKGLEHNLGLPDRDLAVFLAGTPQMDAYLRDLYWAQEYAARNRAVMMAIFQRVVAAEFAARDLDVKFGEQISAHHNYVATETLSDGTELIVTRKGAIRAGAGEYGLIPGSMGTGSYVVKGLGNEASYWSASHGAGRRMSRSKAKRTFTVEDLAAQTAGVECRKDAGVVDEIPGAYKDLGAVIEAQSDLVEVAARLTTLMCVKG